MREHHDANGAGKRASGRPPLYGERVNIRKVGFPPQLAERLVREANARNTRDATDYWNVSRVVVADLAERYGLILVEPVLRGGSR